jgi:hypothetical protein
MWFWCNPPFGILWLIFPVMFLVCLLMMLFCMRRFCGGHFGCCSPRVDCREGAGQNVKPLTAHDHEGSGYPKEERLNVQTHL